jgi:hypothetical protein
MFALSLATMNGTPMLPKEFVSHGKMHVSVIELIDLLTFTAVENASDDDPFPFFFSVLICVTLSFITTKKNLSTVGSTQRIPVVVGNALLSFMFQQN